MPEPDPDLLLVRVDAGAHIGSGHFMRCLALAQAWTDTGRRSIFVSAEADPSGTSMLDAEGIVTERLSLPVGSDGDATATAELAEKFGAAWVVLDGYRFSGDYQRTIREGGSRVLVIDDDGRAGHYHADIIVNQNIGVTRQLYPSPERYTRFLLGTEYVLLRRDFLSSRRSSRDTQSDRCQLLVTLGAGDPANVTSRVVRSLDLLVGRDVDVDVVVGPHNVHRRTVADDIRASHLRMTLVGDVLVMVDLMRKASLAISAAGSTCWELAYMGVPAVVVITADNQVGIATGLHDAGIALNVGWYDKASPEDIAAPVGYLLDDPHLRREMSARGRRAVDGRGAMRVVEELRRHSS